MDLLPGAVLPKPDDFGRPTVSGSAADSSADACHRHGNAIRPAISCVHTRGYWVQSRTTAAGGRNNEQSTTHVIIR